MKKKYLATKAIAEYKQMNVFYRWPNNFHKLTCISHILTARYRFQNIAILVLTPTLSLLYDSNETVIVYSIHFILMGNNFPEVLQS